MRRLFPAAILALALLAARPAESAPPRLVVLVVVDQLRADYVEWYGARWTGGLRRLYGQGAWLRNARYPYLNTITCPGHFTLSTGAYPHRHGMVSNGWPNRERTDSVNCTEDPAATLVAHPGGARAAGGESARNLAIPTLADELSSQLRTKPRIASFSMKARSAIGLVGGVPGTVLWFDDGRWVTSKPYASEPVPWVERFVAANPVAPELARPWDRLLGKDAYRHEDDAPGEKSVDWTPTFPHPLRGDLKPSPYALWAKSPPSDEYLGRLAMAALAQQALGQGPGTDYLAISFSATDHVGHSFGPHSHEVQDALLRLDAALGKLLAALDTHVGAGNYVLAISADHGVAPLPQHQKAVGQDGGRVVPDQVMKVLNAVGKAELGVPEAVFDAPGTDVYLFAGLYQRLAARPGAIDRMLRALRTVPGVADAFDGHTLKPDDKAPARRSAALSWYPGRSGDLVLVPRPNWLIGSGTQGTNHGSPHDYDRHVPLIFFGKGIKPGRYDRAVSPADVAPTLARLIGITLPRAEGTAILDVIDLSPAPRSGKGP